MKMEEIRSLSPTDLMSRGKELRQKIHDLKFQKFSGGEMNTALLGKTRRDLARTLTVLSLSIQQQKKAGGASATASSSETPAAPKKAARAPKTAVKVEKKSTEAKVAKPTARATSPRKTKGAGK